MIQSQNQKNQHQLQFVELDPSTLQRACHRFGAVCPTTGTLYYIHLDKLLPQPSTSTKKNPRIVLDRYVLVIIPGSPNPGFHVLRVLDRLYQIQEKIQTHPNKYYVKHDSQGLQNQQPDHGGKGSTNTECKYGYRGWYYLNDVKQFAQKHAVEEV